MPSDDGNSGDRGDDANDRRPSDRRETPVEPPREDEGQTTDDDEDDDSGDDGAENDQRATKHDPTNDRPPTDYAGTAEEWSGLTDEERRIAVFSILSVEDRDPSVLVPNSAEAIRANGGGGRPDANENGIDADACREIRESMTDALTVREVVEEYPDTHTSEIMRHAYGECRHEDVGVDPTASPQVGRDECFAMRDDYQQGDALSGIAETWARAENTVARHVFGRCSHDARPRDLSSSRVAASECDRVRATYRGNPKVSVQDVACAMRLQKEVVATHLFGYCRHTGDDPDLEPVDAESAPSWDGRDA